MKKMLCPALLTLAFAFAISNPESAIAQRDGPPGQIVFLVGTSPGGGFDLYARTIADYFPKYLPGKPQMIVQNMPGAGGATIGSHVANIAPKDGSVIAMAPPGMVLPEIMDATSVRYGVREFGWVGTMSTTTDVLAVFKTTGINTIDDAKTRTAIIGGTGVSNNLGLYPLLANALLGTKFRMVHGYRGGNEINLAMDQGEVQGRVNQWESWVTQRPQWIRDGKLSYLLQFGPRLPDLGNTPRLLELVKSPREKAMVELVELIQLVGRSIFVPPKVREDILETLRKGFDFTVRDHAYLARMKELQLETFSRSGADLQADLKRTMANSAELVGELNSLLKIK